MAKNENTGGLNMHGPATYRIRVQGRLPADWSERLENMSITIDGSNPKKPVTTLVGDLRDQAALSGVLNTLYEIHLPVISVKCVEKKSTSR
jgi:hypothetical protein